MCSSMQPNLVVEEISLSITPLFKAPPFTELLAPLAQHQSQVRLSLRPADFLGLLPPLHPDDPFHPEDVPLIQLPAPSFCPYPADHCIELPANTEYGMVTHQFAYACSRVLPPADKAGSDLCNVVWPPLVFRSSVPNSEARLDLLAGLPLDHLVFLLAIAHIGRLEHHFALLFDNTITGFARAWVHHCELIGEAGYWRGVAPRPSLRLDVLWRGVTVAWLAARSIV
ncbi:hypothetical protein B0H13DRAFT_2337851 [Mycena leptocephala]|nr:hypothetical protein B0H13DRAFT_2337851 [Mycena leptocephala]